MTGGYSRVQCSLQILYFVADQYSGPRERLLYPKLQTDTLGYSVADRSLYTLSPTDILVCTLDERSLYPGLLTDTLVYSVAYRSWFTLLLTNLPVYSPCDRPLYTGLLTDTPDDSVADRSLYSLLLIQVLYIYNCQQTINPNPVTLSRT